MRDDPVVTSLVTRARHGDQQACDALVERKVEGLQLSLAGANDKLTQIDRRHPTALVDLPAPTMHREH